MRETMTTGRAAARLAMWAFLGFFLLVSLLPLAWLLVNSLKTNLELEAAPFALPARPSLANYATALATADLPRLFANSVLVAACAVALNLAVASLASFALARESFRGREALHTALTAGVLVPLIAFMVPYFTLMTRAGLYDKLAALVLVYAAINIPVSVFLVSSFMRTVPKELEEAAIIDGCGFAGRFWKVVLPLSRSGLVTAGTFCFIYAWNEFLMAMLLTSSLSARTIQLGIRFFTSQFVTDYTGMFAAIVLSIAPTVLAYAFLHDKIVAGLTAGAVKG
ncbi:MAG TPA: carbohydrate ABC transporter permease [Spirochaetales bacterium]|nr:carbohydrate ABC transporter permease [Spirochaetales bacterium]HRY53087.1 carbohydrate ABC transporter permease [Spirochaetia bacterium]HRZ65470.1 carbohydrate ABC transporter permease [Spirochaetia bacterium]